MMMEENDEEDENDVQIHLPVELVNQILRYNSSPLADNFRKSRFYEHDLPFLLLKHCDFGRFLRCHPDRLSYKRIFDDYVYQIYYQLANHALVSSSLRSRIRLFYIYTNDPSARKYSKDLRVNIKYRYFDVLLLARELANVSRHYRRPFECSSRSSQSNSVSPHYILSMIATWILLTCFIVLLIITGILAY